MISSAPTQNLPKNLMNPQAEFKLSTFANLICGV